MTDTLPPEQRACRCRTEDEQAALAAAAPTTGAPYDGYDLPAGCTGYWREDADWGDVLIHDRPCPAHVPEPLAPGTAIAAAVAPGFEPPPSGVTVHYTVTARDLLTNPAEED